MTKSIYSTVVGLLLGSLLPTTEAKPLVIHVMPHSHDDVGWLKTVD